MISAAQHAQQQFGKCLSGAGAQALVFGDADSAFGIRARKYAAAIHRKAVVRLPERIGFRNKELRQMPARPDHSQHDAPEAKAETFSQAGKGVTAPPHFFADWAGVDMIVAARMTTKLSCPKGGHEPVMMRCVRATVSLIPAI